MLQQHPFNIWTIDSNVKHQKDANYMPAALSIAEEALNSKRVTVSLLHKARVLETNFNDF